MHKDKKILELKNFVESAEISLQQARKILIELAGSQEEKMMAAEAKKVGGMSDSEDGQVIEGVFDGQNMVGPDEKKYSVPVNYASKSKLVEGDGLKLTIMADGSFVYKQINLLDRDRLVGELIIDDETNEYRVLANNKSYKILTASVTYFKGEVGNKAAILVPKGRESSWAALENIFKEGQEDYADKSHATPDSTDKEKDSVDKPEISPDSSDKKEDYADKSEIMPDSSDKKEDRIDKPEISADSHDNEEEGIKEKEETTGDEFLSQDNDKEKVSDNLDDKAAGNETAIDSKPDDIFKETDKIKSDDVQKNSLDSDSEQATADLINKEDSNQQADDLEETKDSQGLENI